MCDTLWDAIMDKIRDAMNKDTPTQAKDISSDGNDRWQCACCGAWWYGQQKYCHECGHRQEYK